MKKVGCLKTADLSLKLHGAPVKEVLMKTFPKHIRDNFGRILERLKRVLIVIYLILKILRKFFDF